MATAREAGFTPGNIAITASAHKNIPSLNPRGGILGGIPLDTPGATIDFTVYKVLELDVPHGAGTGTKLEVLADHSTFFGEKMKPGDVRIIHSGYRNFITEGELDMRLREQLQNAGIRVRAYTERDGRVDIEIVKDES